MNLESILIVCGASAGAACLFLWLWCFRIVNTVVDANGRAELLRAVRLHSCIGIALSMALVASSCFLALNNRRSIAEANERAETVARQLARTEALVERLQRSRESQGTLLDDVTRIVEDLETRLSAMSAPERLTVLNELSSIKQRIHAHADPAHDALR